MKPEGTGANKGQLGAQQSQADAPTRDGAPPLYPFQSAAGRIAKMGPRFINCGLPCWFGRCWAVCLIGAVELTRS